MMNRIGVRAFVAGAGLCAVAAAPWAPAAAREEQVMADGRGAAAARPALDRAAPARTGRAVFALG